MNINCLFIVVVKYNNNIVIIYVCVYVFTHTHTHTLLHTLLNEEVDINVIFLNLYVFHCLL